MRIDLGQLSVQGLSLELPATGVDTSPRQATIERAEALRGGLIQAPAGLQLLGVSCARLLLAKLAWRFGKLGLATELSAELRGLKAEADTTTGKLALELALSGLSAARLTLTLGQLRIAAQVEAQNLLLRSGPNLGVLQAERAVFQQFELRTASLSVALPVLTVGDLRVDWGGDAFLLEAGSIEGEQVAFSQAGSTLRGTALTVAALRVIGAAVSVGHARVARLDVAAELPAPAASQPNGEAIAKPVRESSAPAAEPGLPPKAPVFDHELLNGLAGRLNVDVPVDLAVPIIGRRRATHELRIAIEEGALDYRELESNLARLEDSLLDFSVRDGALMLERGLPLIATRGRGKPILIWDLTPEDLALAELRRVRLAVLPRARLAASNGHSEPPPGPREEGGNSGFKLRHLSLQDIDAALELSPTSSQHGAVRELSFSKLRVRGTVHHDPEGPKRAGQLKAGVERLRTSLVGLPIGAQVLRAGIEVGALRDVEAGFDDIHLRRLRAVLEGLVLSGVTLSGH